MRTADPALVAALESGLLRPAVFFKGEFANGDIHIWSGQGEITWGNEVWTGLGALIGFDAVEETTKIEATGTRVYLSGVPTDHVQLALAEARQGLGGWMWLGLLDEDGALIADPVQSFRGRLDVPDISDNAETCTIGITYESHLIDLTTPRELRYTDETQQILYPGDRGFEYVAGLQDKEIVWGR